VSPAIEKNASSASGTGLGRCLGFLPVCLRHKIAASGQAGRADLVMPRREGTEEKVMMMMMNKYQQTA
jgi:hypothetical protein